MSAEMTRAYEALQQAEKWAYDTPEERSYLTESIANSLLSIAISLDAIAKAIGEEQS